MKRFLAALLCLVMVLALIPACASAEYSTTSNRGVELVTPDAKDFFKTPFWCRLFRSDYIKGLYIMPKPETGNGHLGSVTLPGRVYVMAEKNGFYYFVTSTGKSGWAWNEWFDFDREKVSLAKGGGSKDTPLYPTLSNRGAELVFPEDDEYLEDSDTMTVKTEKPWGGIYLMPMPEKGHGNLGTIGCGEEVTILAECDGFYFFQTDDGRYGWNDESWFR